MRNARLCSKIAAALFLLALSSSSQMSQAPSPAARPVLGVVVLDPAHGGTDPGARGAGGLRESDIVLNLAAAVKTALERQGFQVVLTRQGNDDRQFDERSTLANAQRGAIFLTLHVSSTGLPGTIRVYTAPHALGDVAAPGGFLPWDRAQGAFLPLSRRLGDLLQGELTQRFKGSPSASQPASVRQLRTIALPAVAIELSSVVIENPSDLDRMFPGAAEAVARAVSSFKPIYDSTPLPGGAP